MAPEKISMSFGEFCKPQGKTCRHKRGCVLAVGKLESPPTDESEFYAHLVDFADKKRLKVSTMTTSGANHYVYCRTHEKCKSSLKAVYLNEEGSHYIEISSNGVAHTGEVISGVEERLEHLRRHNATRDQETST